MKTKHDLQYLALVDNVLTNGTKKRNRTGVDTISIFGPQMRFDLRDNTIPLLTTKKMFTRGVIREILWYLQGSDNIKYLQDNDVHIWDEWAAHDGHLRKVYGYQWRRWEAPNSNETVMIDCLPPPSNIAETLNSLPALHNIQSPLANVWLDIRIAQSRGSYVSDEWSKYEDFERDIKSVVNYTSWLCAPDEWILSQHYYGSNSFGPSTSIFLKKSYAEQLATEYATKSAIGSTLPDPVHPLGKVERVRQYFDQIDDLIQTLRANPDDRRMIVTAWNVADVPGMALPPCHYTFQVYTRPLSHEERAARSDTRKKSTITTEELDELGVPSRELSMILNQRSCDVGLGVPFNIVQYSILMRMICHVVNMTPGDFIWNGGDAHIYENHVEQLKRQLKLDPKDSPMLHFRNQISNIDRFNYEDFEIVGYSSHPTLKMDVAV